MVQTALAQDPVITLLHFADCGTLRPNALFLVFPVPRIFSSALQKVFLSDSPPCTSCLPSQQCEELSPRSPRYSQAQGPCRPPRRQVQGPCCPSQRQPWNIHPGNLSARWSEYLWGWHSRLLLLLWQSSPGPALLYLLLFLLPLFLPLLLLLLHVSLFNVLVIQSFSIISPFNSLAAI